MDANARAYLVEHRLIIVNARIRTVVIILVANILVGRRYKVKGRFGVFIVTRIKEESTSYADVLFVCMNGQHGRFLIFCVGVFLAK